MIYLDYSADTPVDSDVLKYFTEVAGKAVGNANSAHIAGVESKKLQDEMTRFAAETLSVLPEEIIYTSGASEGNNLAIKGIARTARHFGRHIITTPLEHPSVSAPLTALQEQGYEVDMVNIDTDGRVDLGHLRSLLRNDTILVTVCAVDSELGTLQPVDEISKILCDYPNCKLHIDATQAVGKIDIDFSLADTVCLSAHKFYGIVGSGVLVKKKNIILEPLIHGGNSTSIYRSGTPTVALNCSLCKALGIAAQNLESRYNYVLTLNKRLRNELKKFPKVRINSPDNAIPHILNISVDGIRGRDFQRALSERGICVSVKSACSTDNLPSRAVFAVSRNRKNALNSWRISLSHLTTDEEIDGFLTTFEKIYKEHVA